MSYLKPMVRLVILANFTKERKKRYKVSVPRMNEHYPHRTHKQVENREFYGKLK